MIFTGKCRRDFIDWYKLIYLRQYPWWARPFGFSSFCKDTLSEQWGVYQDFSSWSNLDMDENYYRIYGCQKRPEARKGTLLHFNEEYNEIRKVNQAD